MKPEKTVVAQSLSAGSESDATLAGKLFAQSETHAAESLDLFARLVGDSPTWEVWEAERLKFINGYVGVKPTTKGDAAYKAFGRFKNRLVETYAITIPKASTAAAEKKAAERKAKRDKVIATYAGKTDGELHDLIAREYEKQAKNPLASDALLREMKGVIKERRKEIDAATRDSLKAQRAVVIKAVRACTDTTRLTMALEILDVSNEIRVTQ